MKGEKVASIDVSPAGNALLMVTRTPADKPRETDVPRFVTKSGYVDEIKGREKVGDAQDGGRVAFVSLPSGRARWLHVVPDDTTKSPALARVLGWNERGDRAVVYAVRSDWKARFIETVDADSGRVQVADVLRDTAWVDGPALARDPAHGKAHSNLGVALQLTGKLGESIEHGETAVSLLPQNAETHYNLGNSLARAGREGEALRCFARAVELRPDFASARYGLGQMLLRTGRPREAIPQLEAALQLQPNFADAQRTLAEARSAIAAAGEKP